jgi:ATP-dependent helicase HrpA
MSDLGGGVAPPGIGSIAPATSVLTLSPPQFPSDSDLATCLCADRRALVQRLRGLRRRAREGQPLDQGLARLWQAVRISQGLVARRRALVPTIVYPPELPVSERRDEVAELIARHQVIVLCGETGSGKSTQLPKICLGLGRGVFGRIGHTQPRRIAARTLAARVAQELGGETGGLVGYKVRFHDRVRPETGIKLMTDGILLAEIQHDRLLLEYDTLIVDEAHERSLNIDFLLGYLKQLLPRRPDLKVIVTSATIDPERFARHFAADGTPAPVIEISGRTYPVEVRHRPPVEDENAGERDEAMQQAISEAVAELAREGRGDVLVFLSGEREIRETAETLRKHHPPSTEILPLFARQGPEEQARVFKAHATRRVVLATNVAETSLTVPGHPLCGRPGIRPHQPLQPPQQGPAPAGGADLPGVRQPAQGALRAGRGRGLHPALFGGQLRSAGALYRARDPTDQPGRRHPPDEDAGLRRHRVLPLPGSPGRAPDRGRLPHPGGAGRHRPARRADPLGLKLARLPVDPRIGRMLLAAAERHCLRRS